MLSEFPFCPRPGFQKRLGSLCYRRMTAVLRLQDFAEFFAELCALHAPIAPIAPFYSVENIATPAFSHRLLTEGRVLLKSKCIRLQEPGMSWSTRVCPYVGRRPGVFRMIMLPT